MDAWLDWIGFCVLPCRRMFLFRKQMAESELARRKGRTEERSAFLLGRGFAGEEGDDGDGDGDGDGTTEPSEPADLTARRPSF